MGKMKKYWVQLEAGAMGFDAHLTVHYIGSMEDATKSKVEKWLSLHGGNSYFCFVQPLSIDLFGPDNKIPVIKVSLPEHLIRVKKRLEGLVPSGSEYEWNPHITIPSEIIGNLTIHIPQVIDLSNLTLEHSA